MRSLLREYNATPWRLGGIRVTLAWVCQGLMVDNPVDVSGALRRADAPTSLRSSGRPALRYSGGPRLHRSAGNNSTRSHDEEDSVSGSPSIYDYVDVRRSVQPHGASDPISTERTPTHLDADSRKAPLKATARPQVRRNRFGAW